MNPADLSTFVVLAQRLPDHHWWMMACAKAPAYSMIIIADGLNNA